MKRVAVLLTVFNRRESTLRCLRQLRGLTPVAGHTLEIFLTDDGCTDGTAEAVSTNFPDVHIVKGDGNLFWNRGMHAAWEAAVAYAPYDFYLWLNDDTFVYPNLLATLINAAKQTREQAIIVAPTCATNNHKLLTYGGRTNDSKQIAEPKGKLTPVDYFNGNIVLVPKAVYEKVGNLDPSFRHSKGDFDYGCRAKKLGFAIFQTGQVLGACDLHPSLDAWCNPEVPLAKRWHALHKPNGMPPRETFYFELRHTGLLTASFHFLTVHLRCLCPHLWAKRNKRALSAVRNS